MAGPGARIVDRVGVLVLPDTSKFVPSLERYLARIQRSLRVELPTSLDLDGISRDLTRVKAAAEKLRVQVPVDYDEPTGPPHLPKPDPVEVPVRPDSDVFLARAAADVKAAQRDIELHVPLTAQGERLRGEVAAKVAALQAEIRKAALVVPVNPEMAARQKVELRAKIAELQAVARAHKVEVPVEVDEKGAKDSLERLKGFLARFNSISARGSGMSMRAQLYTGLGLAALAATPGVLSLASALTKLAGFAALIPAAAGAATGAIGALVLGFKGFGEALSNVGDPEKFSKSLEGLAPNAREAATAIRDSLPAWKEMQQSVQNVLFDGFADSVRMLTTALLPSLQVGLTANAEAMSGLGERFAAGIAQAGRLGQISAIFENSAASLGNLRGAIVPVIDGLMTLGVAGSTWLPKLTAGAADAAKRFQEWAAIKVENGDFDRWVQGAIDTLRQLADVGRSAFSIIKSLMDAANSAGATGLDSLQGGLARIAEVMRGPEFQAGLTAFFEGIRAGSAGVASALPAIGSALAALGAAVGPVAAVMGPVLGRALEIVAQAVQVAAPYVQQIATLLGQTLLESLNLLAPALGPLIEQLGTALVTALSAIAPLIPQIIAAVLPLIPAIGELLPPLGRLIAEVAPALVAFIQAATPLIQVLAQVVTVLAQAIDTLLVPSMKGMAEFAQFSFGIAGKAAQVFQAVVTPVLDAVSALLRGDFSQAWSAASAAVGAALRSALGFVVGIGASIAGSVRSMGSAVVSTAQQAWSSFVQAVSSAASRAAGAASAIPGAILAALGSLGGLLYGAGQSLVQGLINGIGSMIGAVASKASEIAGTIRGFFPGSPVKEGPLRSWNNGGAGVRLGAMLAAGLDASRTDVAAAADRLAAQVDFTTRAATPTRFVFEQTGTAAAGSPGAGMTVQVLGDVWGKPSDYIDQLMAGVDEALTLSRLRDAVQA